MPAPPKLSGSVPQQAPAPQRERPHLELVAPAPRLRLSRRFVIMFLGTGLAALLMALVALHVLIAQEQFRIDGLQARAATEQATYEKLRLSIAQLESPARIVYLAEGKLGMRQPGSVTYLPPLSGARSQPRGSLGKGTRGAPSAISSTAGVRPAPAGDANWPAIKPYLSGTP